MPCLKSRGYLKHGIIYLLGFGGSPDEMVFYNRSILLMQSTVAGLG